MAETARVQVPIVEETRGDVVDAAESAISADRVAVAQISAAASPASASMRRRGQQIDLALAMLLLERARLRRQVLGQRAYLTVVHVEQNGLAKRGGQSAHKRRVVVVARRSS